MQKRWVIKEQGDKKKVKELAESLNVDENLSNLLVQRGVTTFDEARAYFRPSLSRLHDPFLMKDMDKAVDRVIKAIDRNEKVMIYGDYDVDGTTSVALLYTFLEQFIDEIEYYVPDRYAEGYGVSYQGIEVAISSGVGLVIVLDCGIKAVEKINYAKENGVDFIICDHHRPGEMIPSACAVLDPKRPDCHYPYKDLSGCGVGFKLVQALASKLGVPFENLMEYLDLVVVSIAADIVPITGENRILAYYGLKRINQNPRPGIESVLRYSGINKIADGIDEFNFNREISVADLVFLVGPRINAAGRIEDAKNSVKLLVTREMEYANLLAEQINSLNIERKSLDLNATQEALEVIKQDDVLVDAKSTVVYNPNWHKGVIGIVASRLTEVYYRPTIVLTQANGLLTGSARSIKDFDVYDALDHCSDLLEHFGGHKYAAGLSLKPEHLEPFRDKFEEYVTRHINEKMMIPEVEVDARLYLKDINSKFVRILKQFAPFGPGNQSPIFQTDDLIDTGRARVVGKNHLKLEVVHLNITGFPFSSIAFQQGDHLERISNGEAFSIVYHIEENEWNGVKSLQLNIKDIKFKKDTEIYN
jgi:single-stranded-DNA-specific exonuclease